MKTQFIRRGVRHIGKSRLRFSSLRTRRKIYNRLWVFHIGDQDFIPSVPHGHSEDGKYKLSLWDGTVYSVQSGNAVGTASRSEMEHLYESEEMQQFITKARKWYEDNHPYCPAMTPLRGTNIVLNRKSRMKLRRRGDTIRVFIHCQINQEENQC